MTYCSSCGREVPVDATFCPNCGASISSATGSAKATVYEVDRLVNDTKTQEFWFKRAVAYVIDWIIVAIATAIIEFALLLAFGIATGLLFTNPLGLFVPFGFASFGFFGLGAILFLLYFTISEAEYKTTIGKSVMGLKVTTTDGSRFDIGKSFVRNVSKIYWLLLLLDLIGGFFTHVQAGQRYSDHIAHTVVVASR